MSGSSPKKFLFPLIIIGVMIQIYFAYYKFSQQYDYVPDLHEKFDPPLPIPDIIKETDRLVPLDNSETKSIGNIDQNDIKKEEDEKKNIDPENINVREETTALDPEEVKEKPGTGVEDTGKSDKITDDKAGENESTKVIDDKITPIHSKNKVAIINTWVGDTLPNVFLEGLYTWGGNEDVLDYFLFVNDGTKIRKQIQEKFPRKFDNIFIIDVYPKQNSLLDFIKIEFLRLLKEGLNIEPEMNYNLGSKLCDIRSLFGDIFQPWISNYEYWGWTDQHVYAGNLKPYLDAYMPKFDIISFAPPNGGGWRLYTTGRLSIFRNSDPKIRSYWKLAKPDIVYDRIHQKGGGAVMDEWWFSMPIFYDENISYMQTYLQSDNSQQTYWYTLCGSKMEEDYFLMESSSTTHTEIQSGVENQNESEKKITKEKIDRRRDIEIDSQTICKHYYLWKKEITPYWYEGMKTITGPERLDETYTMTNYLQPWGDTKNLDMEHLAGFYELYRWEGKWYRKNITSIKTPSIVGGKENDNMVINYNNQTKHIILQPAIVHARTPLCFISSKVVAKFRTFEKTDVLCLRPEQKYKMQIV